MNDASAETQYFPRLNIPFDLPKATRGGSTKNKLIAHTLEDVNITIMAQKIDANNLVFTALVEVSLEMTCIFPPRTTEPVQVYMTIDEEGTPCWKMHDQGAPAMVDMYSDDTRQSVGFKLNLQLKMTSYLTTPIQAFVFTFKVCIYMTAHMTTAQPTCAYIVVHIVVLHHATSLNMPTVLCGSPRPQWPTRTSAPSRSRSSNPQSRSTSCC